MNSLSTARLVCLLWLALTVAAQEKKDAKPDEPHPNLPVAQWLRGSDRTDFKWRVELLPPRMTFQQRYLVQVRAYVDVQPLVGDDKRDFYFLLKVADEMGNWLPNDTYNHYPLPPGLDKKSEIQYATGLYAKPGKYTAALVLFDAVQGQGNVWRKQFEVKAPKKDPLPTMDRDIPAIEFLTEVPSDALPTHERVAVMRRGRLAVPAISGSSEASDEEWPPGHGSEFLPVRPPRPLRVDIVLNFAPWIDPYLQRRTTASAYRADSGRMLQIGAVLSHLNVERGCVRVGAVDLSKLTVVFNRLDGHDADWDKITEQVRKIDHNTVSAAVLGNRKSTAGFLRDYMTDLMTDASGCGPGSEKTDHVIVLVSHDFQFPAGTRGDRLWPDVQCSSCRYYHLRINGGGPGSSDDLEKFFKAANPRRFDVNSPEQFRKALAEMIDEFSGGRERAREAAR